MNKRTIKDIDVYDKAVLVRVDFNVPVIDGAITDDNRIVEAMPTINYLLEKGASVILMSHLGRPDGKVVKKYSLSVVSKRLKELLPNNKVIMAKDVTGKDAKEKAVLAKQSFINAMQSSNSSGQPNAELQRLIEDAERVAKLA